MLTLAGFFAKAQEEKPKHKEEHYHLSAFAGYTTDYKGRTGYKLGVEYEGRINEWLGVGGTFDFTGADFDIFAFSVGFDVYPFKFPLIPAFAFGWKNPGGTVWKPFFRGMAVYDFHVRNLSIGPMIMYDWFFDSKDIMSYGVTVGYSLH